MPVDSPPPAPVQQWWQQPWVKRLGVAIAGAAILASCPFWPKPLQPICGILSDSLAQRAQLDGGAP